MMDRDRQEDEIASLAEIYDTEEFSFVKKESPEDGIECRLNGIFTLPEKLLKVKYLNHNLQRRCPSLPYLKFFVRHLPPANLYVTLPSDYPSLNPPNFRLSISWLPTWETSRICQKLDELWVDNQGNEILFIWMNFLKFELLTFLDIQYCLDVSILFTAFEEPDNYLKSDLNQLSDSRATNDNMFLNPKVYLAKYEYQRQKIHFQKSFYHCKICLDEFLGKQCIEFNKCGHVYCKICAREYVSLCIRERRVNCMLCPEQKCKSEVTPDQVKELVSSELYERYEYLLLQVTLDSMSDIVYCPRLDCQYPVTKDGDENLATCANCLYNFCVYCHKVYHGVAPCSMTSNDKKKLIVEYETANPDQKKLLEKKYGRRQLQIVVEKYLTNSYLKVYHQIFYSMHAEHQQLETCSVDILGDTKNENTKQCPNCLTSTSKIEGCNKMICGHCQANFCWLCGKHLVDPNPYSHFNDSINNPCYERLFEGIIFTDDIFEGDNEGEELWEEFPVE